MKTKELINSRIMSILLSILLILILVLLPTEVCLATNNSSVRIKLDGEILSLDKEVIIKEGRTLVPVRAVMEAMGLAVTWDDKNKIVFLYTDDDIITLPIDSKEVIINERDIERKLTIDVPAQIINSSTYVPVRFVSESIGAQINWNEKEKIVEITSPREYGTKEYSNGYYEGEMTFGIENGHGKYYWNNEDWFEGTWKNGQRLEGIYYFNNGDMYEGTFNEGQLERGVYTFSDGNQKIIDITQSEKEQEETTFKDKALDGPSYDELMSNQYKYIDEPVYISGKVIQVITYEDGSQLIFVDESAWMNSFIDMYNDTNYDEYNIPSGDEKIVAIFTDEEVDIIQNDTVRVYGLSKGLISYETITGFINTVPSVKLVEYERNERVKDIYDDLLKNGKQDINDFFRND